MFYCQLSDSLVITLIDYLEILDDLANIGTIPGRFTRGQAIKCTAGCCRCAIGTIWVFTQGVGEVICQFFDSGLHLNAP